MQPNPINEPGPPERSEAVLGAVGVGGAGNPTLCRVIAVLLSYPDGSWLAELDDLRAVSLEVPELSPAARAELTQLFDHLSAVDELELAEEYVRWFDRTRSLSLHLFEHSHGEARERGEAMARLLGIYAERGWDLVSGELPDYLPALCEFLGLSPEPLRRALLAEARPILVELYERMRERGCPYAGALAPLLEGSAIATGAFDPDVTERGSDDLEALDALWREEPVSFGLGAAHDSAFVPASRLSVRSRVGAAQTPSDGAQPDTFTQNTAQAAARSAAGD